MAKLSPEGIQRLKGLVRDGVTVLQECEDLRAGLSDTIKSVAEELEVKPAIIQRLIRDIQKNRINDKREDEEIFQELYKAAGLG